MEGEATSRLLTIAQISMIIKSVWLLVGFTIWGCRNIVTIIILMNQDCMKERILVDRFWLASFYILTLFGLLLAFISLIGLPMFVLYKCYEQTDRKNESNPYHHTTTNSQILQSSSNKLMTTSVVSADPYTSVAAGSPKRSIRIQANNRSVSNASYSNIGPIVTQEIVEIKFVNERDAPLSLEDAKLYLLDWLVFRRQAQRAIAPLQVKKHVGKSAANEISLRDPKANASLLTGAKQ